MASEIVLITGANTGIGHQIVRSLCRSNKAYQILVGGRTPSKVEAAIKSATQEYPDTRSSLSPITIDIESDESIKQAYEEVQSKFGKLDALINNAGAQLDPQYQQGKITERELWNRSWDVNVSGTQVMTSTFVPMLIKTPNPRLLFVTSGTSTLTGSENMAAWFNKPPPAGWPKEQYNIPAYRSAKTGMNMMMREWHRLLRNDGVKVWCISPGFLATGLGGVGEDTLKSLGAGDPADSGDQFRNVLEGNRDDDIGKVLFKDGVQGW